MAFLYTTKAKVEGLLPSSLPSSITDADFTDWINDASKEVDEEVGAKYPVLDSGQKFEDYSDTPAAIERCARWLAGANGYDRLKEINKAPNVVSNAERLRKRAMDKLEKIALDRTQVYGDDGETLSTDNPIHLAVTTRTQQFTGDELAKY